MIELTETQRQGLRKPDGELPRVLDPLTKQQYVLLELETYLELTKAAYDDSPWTVEEMDLLAAEVDAMLEAAS
jgi:hypothetical protein